MKPDTIRSLLCAMGEFLCPNDVASVFYQLEAAHKQLEAAHKQLEAAHKQLEAAHKQLEAAHNTRSSPCFLYLLSHARGLAFGLVLTALLDIKRKKLYYI